MEQQVAAWLAQINEMRQYTEQNRQALTNFRNTTEPKIQEHEHDIARCRENDSIH